MDSRGFDYTALVLTIIGAINWGLIGLFKFDLVAFVFGDMTVMSRIVYAIVGRSLSYKRIWQNSRFWPGLKI